MTPTVVEIPSGMVGSSARITVRKGGVEKDVDIPRSETDWGSFGAAVAIDTAVCLGCTTAGVVIAVVAPTCAPGACAGLAAYLALPLQFYLSGAKPEQKPVHVELGPAQPKADPAPATPVPTTPEPPQPQYGY